MATETRPSSTAAAVSTRTMRSNVKVGTIPATDLPPTTNPQDSTHPHKNTATPTNPKKIPHHKQSVTSRSLSRCPTSVCVSLSESVSCVSVKRQTPVHLVLPRALPRLSTVVSVVPTNGSTVNTATQVVRKGLLLYPNPNLPNDFAPFVEVFILFESVFLKV